jgi:hypothetical protein
VGLSPNFVIETSVERTNRTEEKTMLIKRCLVALGFVSAMAISAPALAQGVSLHGPGVSLHFGHHDRGDRDRSWRRADRNWERGDRDRSRRRAERDRNWERADRDRRRAERGFAFERERFGGCRTVTIEHDNGDVRRVRRCD